MGTNWRCLLAISVAVPAAASISFHCDPTFNTDAPANTCSYLNTTIAGLYSNVFSNANASIYITFGSTGLGQSTTALDLYTFSQYSSAYNANISDATQQTAYTDNIASEPAKFGSDGVALTTALSDALGLGATAGLTSTGAGCTISVSNPNCYNGVITITNATNTLWYRTLSGTAIPSGEYDFFSVVEHETDEVLGTASCVGDCKFTGKQYIAPADLFRFSSNGSRTFSAGDNNNGCGSSTPSSTNACFSIDGGNTFLYQWNNVNGGGDFGDWVPNCPTAPQVQDLSGCPGVGNIDITNDKGFEIELLNAGGFQETAEPATMVLSGAGLILLAVASRRYRAS